MTISLPPGLQVLLALVAVVAGIYDIRYRRIPNWLALAGLLAGIAMNTFLFDLSGLKAAGMGLGLAFLIYLPLYLLRAMGAGDVKLMAALGAIAGPGNWFILFLFTAILGGFLGVIFLLFKGRIRKTFWNMGWILHEILHLRAPYHSSEELDVRSDRAVRMPHGAVIALATLALLSVQAIRGAGKPLF
jgi:prepilin peptidase CpaA